MFKRILISLGTAALLAAPAAPVIAAMASSPAPVPVADAPPTYYHN